jgi:hypothetical protein
MTKAIIALALLTCAGSPAVAQQLLVVGAPQGMALRAGMEVPMRTLEELTTQGKALRAGQHFELETIAPISLNGRVVIPTGTHGVGEVTSVRNKGMLGRSGQIETRLLYLRVGERQIRISGVSNDKGVAGTAGVVGTAIFIWPVAFFVTGTSARIPVGAPVKAFLDEDVPVAFADGMNAAPPLPVSAVQTVSQVTPAATFAPEPARAPSARPAVATPAVLVSHATSSPEGPLPIYVGDIDRKYQIIGAVQVAVANIDPNKPAGRAKILGKLWDKAKLLGADAVIHASIGEPHMTAMVARKMDVTGVAVKFETGPAAEMASRP